MFGDIGICVLVIFAALANLRTDAAETAKIAPHTFTIPDITKWLTS